jgi:hypothetical protein
MGERVVVDEPLGEGFAEVIRRGPYEGPNDVFLDGFHVAFGVGVSFGVVVAGEDLVDAESFEVIDVGLGGGLATVVADQAEFDSGSVLDSGRERRETAMSRAAFQSAVRLRSERCQPTTFLLPRRGRHGGRASHRNQEIGTLNQSANALVVDFYLGTLGLDLATKVGVDAAASPSRVQALECHDALHHLLVSLGVTRLALAIHQPFFYSKVSSPMVLAIFSHLASKRVTWLSMPPRSRLALAPLRKAFCRSRRPKRCPPSLGRSTDRLRWDNLLSYSGGCLRGAQHKTHCFSCIYPLIGHIMR